MQVSPLIDLHTTARPLRLMASLRASIKLEKNELTAIVKRIELTITARGGAARDCKIAITATTTSNSINVKPALKDRLSMRISLVCLQGGLAPA